MVMVGNAWRGFSTVWLFTCKMTVIPQARRWSTRHVRCREESRSIMINKQRLHYVTTVPTIVPVRYYPVPCYLYPCRFRDCSESFNYSTTNTTLYIPVLLLLCNNTPLHSLQGQATPIQIRNIKNFRMIKHNKTIGKRTNPPR